MLNNPPVKLRPKTVNVKLRLDSGLHEQLKRLAIDSEGTVAAEMRKALRAYVRQSEAKRR